MGLIKSLFSLAIGVEGKLEAGSSTTSMTAGSWLHWDNDWFSFPASSRMLRMVFSGMPVRTKIACRLELTLRNEKRLLFSCVDGRLMKFHKWMTTALTASSTEFLPILKRVKRANNWKIPNRRYEEQKTSTRKATVQGSCLRHSEQRVGGKAPERAP